jgi:hypothetical protein
VKRNNSSILHGVGVVALGGLLAMLTWGFPAIYANRYEHPAASSAAASPATHPKPSAEQDRIYTDRTVTRAPNPGVAVEGRDGYLFLGDVFLSNFAQALGRRYYSPQEVARTTSTIESERSWLKARKIPMEFIVAPAKWSIYPDKLPAWSDGQSLQHIVDQLLTYDPKSILDLRPDLTAARTSHEPYSRKNSHWSPYGGYVGFSSIVRQLQARHPELGTVRVPKLSSVTTVNEQNEFAPLIKDPGPNDWTIPHFSPDLPGYDLVQANGARVRQAPGTRLDVSQGPFQTASATAGNTHRVLILADSTVSSLSPYLATEFGSTLIVRHFIDDPGRAPSIPALVESYHPDLVLTVTTERNLNEPIHDLEMWQSALDYDRAAKDSAASWTAGGARGPTISVTGPTNLIGPLTVRLPKQLTTSNAIRIQVNSSAPVMLALKGTTTAGPFSIPLRIGPGPNTTFATVPAGITNQTLTLVRTSGNGAATATAVSARGLP